MHGIGIPASRSQFVETTLAFRPKPFAQRKISVTPISLPNWWRIWSGLAPIPFRRNRATIA